MTHPDNPAKITSLAALTWIQGAWRGQTATVIVEERWSGLLGNSMMGMFRYIEGEQTRFFEMMTLEMEGEQAILRIKHFHPGLVGWEEKDEAVEYVLVSHTIGEAVFLRRNPGDGNWMVYRRSDDDLTVTFESGTGQKVEGEFAFTRQREDAFMEEVLCQ
jgi:hypothetical protein